MKRLLFTTIALALFLLSSLAFAKDCPLVGNTYILETKDTIYELSDFECGGFGPGYSGDCQLLWGPIPDGPFIAKRFPFACNGNDVYIDNLPCIIGSDGRLKCLLVDVSGYHCMSLGNKIWCFSEEPMAIQLELEKEED